MRLQRSREWWLARARAEPDVPISAGIPEVEKDERQCDLVGKAGELEINDVPAIFSEFVHLLRRKRGLSIEEFADAVHIDVSEAQVLEEDPFYSPEPRTVYYIARAFNMPQAALNSYAGVTIANDFEAISGGQRFAARSESRSKLSGEELLLLNAIVAVLEEREARAKA